MPRILIVECKQEVSTFNPALSHYGDFIIHRDAQLIQHHRAVRNEVGGALSVFDQHDDIEVIPVISARAITSGGTLAGADWTQLSQELVEALRASADSSAPSVSPTTSDAPTPSAYLPRSRLVPRSRFRGPNRAEGSGTEGFAGGTSFGGTTAGRSAPKGSGIGTFPSVDAAYFCLHGAMAAENEPDPEGFLLQEARRILGPHVPIVASFDLHGILTDRILDNADAIACYHTYPHVDFFETGQRAARLLLRIMNGAKPMTAKVFVPALVRGDELITETGAIRHAVNAAKELEANGALSAGLFWGNPFTDVPDLATYSFVVTDGDEDRAKREASRIAGLFWREHEKMRVPLTSLDDAVKIAHENTAGTTILVDAADATSSGASGDSNVILRKLIETGYTGSALIPMVDAPAAAAAFKAGVGEVIHVTVGGSLDPTRFTPLKVEAYVQMLSDGLFTSESFGERWYAGKTAVLLVGNITVIVTSRAVSLYDRSLFLAHGQDPKLFDCVVVKSPHCQPHMFKGWAARYVDVDAPGSTSANLASLGHIKCPRPMWPLDDDVVWVAEAKVYRRSLTTDH